MFGKRFNLQHRVPQGLKNTTMAFLLVACCLGTCLGLDKMVEIEAGKYHPAGGRFFASQDEKLQPLELTSLTVSEANQRIADARKKSPESVLALSLDGPLRIEDAALRLPGLTALHLGPNATIVAGKTATAESLVEITDSESIRISATNNTALLDGNNVVSTGIRVRKSGKILLDHIEIRRMTNTGIDYQGRGHERYSDAGAVTRCRISDCAKGIVVRSACQFICLESTIERCSVVGLDVSSAGAVVAGNVFTKNQIGSVLALLDGAAVQNTYQGNAIGCRLGENSEISLFWQNHLTDNEIGLDLGGTSNVLLDNTLNNSRNIVAGGTGNQLVSHSTLLAHEAAGGDTLYFHPPTLSNPHQDELIFKGKNRFDMHFIKGGKLSDVQAALDQARKAHPEDVIVAHLKGVFIADGAGPSGLSLPDFTCVILDGEIQSYNEQLREVILLGGNGCASFSGGVIDCNGKGLDGKRSGYAINVPGDNLALVDAVTLRNSFKESIMTQHHTRLDRSLVIRNCTIENSGRRGIWGHVSQNVVIVNCDVRDSKSDGIDIDAHCMHAKVLGNQCSGNQRHGVFVEEAVKGALVFGNHLHDNYRGIHVWNEEVIGNTGPNLFACNLLEKNERGFSVGGRADDRTAHTNFFFNNISRLNEQGLAVIKHADENYFCENWLYDNDEDFLDWTGKAGSVWWLGRSDKERK